MNYLGGVQFLLKQVPIQRCHGAVHGTSSSQPRLVSPIDTIGDTQYGVVFSRTDGKAIGNRFTYVHSARSTDIGPLGTRTIDLIGERIAIIERCR